LGFLEAGREGLGFSCANGGLMGDPSKILIFIAKKFFLGVFFVGGVFLIFFCFVYAKMAFM
jgi:hypothetical protein